MRLSRRLFLGLLPATICLSGCGSKPRVVLYCAEDRDFAVGVLKDFTGDTGLEVMPKFDTEANKSVGLYSESSPRRTAALRRVLEQRDPQTRSACSSRGCWSPTTAPPRRPIPNGRGRRTHLARLRRPARVLIVNTKLVREKERPKKSC